MSAPNNAPRPRPKIDKATLIVYSIIGVLLLLICMLLGAAMDYSVVNGKVNSGKIGKSISYLLTHPGKIFAALGTKGGYAPKMVFFGIMIIGIFALYKYSEDVKRLHRRGTEHGSAKWGSEKEMAALADKGKPVQYPIKRYDAEHPEGVRVFDEHGELCCVQIDNNIILNKDVKLSLNSWNHKLNFNVLVIGGSGAQKTRGFEKFNTDRPSDFFGHSMSTSDVIVVTEGSGRTPYYVQPVGFEVMPEFLAHRFDLIDIQFTGNPEGFNAIKVAARTDSFEDTGETNMQIPDTPVFYARLSETAVLADVQKVIVTAQENGCYLNGSSVAYLTERFGADFMPEQDTDLTFTLPESGIMIDLAASESVTLTDSYSQYEGGIDSDGHERRDNYSSQSQSVTYSYRGHGIVEAVSYSSDRDFPIEEEYNIYDPAQREKLAADMRRFAERAESLTMHSEPKAVQAERNFVLILNDNGHQIQFGEAFDTLDSAQDAGNEAIWGGRAVGYAVLNRQEQKVEVYDSDFPTSGVFSEEVYRNSPFQTLTVHTDVPRYSHLKAILSSGQDAEYEEKKKQQNESSPAGFVRGAAYYGGDDHAE